MVEFLAGNKIRGTSSERGSIGTTLGSWKELARTKLGVDGDDLNVINIPNKRYYMILTNKIADGAIAPDGKLNADGGSSYATRRATNGGGTDTLQTSVTAMASRGATDTQTTPLFWVEYIANVLTRNKLGISYSVSQGVLGAGNSPDRREMNIKWGNTTESINSYNLNNSVGGQFGVGSEVVVLGWDTADAHSDNFWQELYSTTLTYDNGSFDTGIMPTKKYLWVQFFQKGHSGNSELFFNGDDAGSNFAGRISANGGVDSTVINVSKILNVLTGGTADLTTFANMFIVNNLSEEKLGYAHTCHTSTAGATSVPARSEYAFKWAKTTEQINRIQLTDSGAGFDTGSRIIVWGAN